MLQELEEATQRQQQAEAKFQRAESMRSDAELRLGKEQERRYDPLHWVALSRRGCTSDTK